AERGYNRERRRERRRERIAERDGRQGRTTGANERGDRGGRERRPTGTISEDGLSQRFELTQH
ncbi:hypothetical protein LINPERPRIM_LOCUS37732, partial [Linum perenne]